MGWGWGRIGRAAITGGLSEAWNPDNYVDVANGATGDDIDEHDPANTSKVPDLDRNNFNLVGADSRGDFLRGGAQNAQTREAPQAGQSSFAGDQRALVDRLRDQMDGKDSLSQLQLRDATDSNIAQQQSQAAGASPGSAAMARRMAMQNTGKMNQGFGAQAAQLGIQERNAAANALGSVSSTARGQDQQNNQFNVGAQLQQRGMNDQYTQDMSALELQNAGMQQAGSMGYEQQQTQRRSQDLGVPTLPSTLDRLIGVGGAVAPYALASDARLKTNIHPADGEVDTLIARLRPAEYEYRDPRLGAGPRVGVLAQDVEQGGPAGRAMVTEEGGPGGPKMLDVPKSLGTALAAIGRLGERVAQVEGRGTSTSALERLGGLASRMKTSPGADERARPPAPKVAAKRRGILPGELAKDASGTSERSR